MAITFDLGIVVRDGVRLSADLYSPEGAGPWPCVIVRTPYGKGQGLLPTRSRKFAAAGYAALTVDVRGRGDSDGPFVPYRGEGKDGFDVIEWCAGQPWCNGRVATWGSSYAGRVQWFTALEAPPHLKAMSVAVPPSDPFVESPTGTTGPMHLCWNHLTSGRQVQDLNAVDWERVYEHLPLLTMDEAAGHKSPRWREDLAHTKFDEYWQAICYQHRLHEIDLPVLHISGWYDDEQIGTPLNFMRMHSKAPSAKARAGQRLLMGPWPHGVYGANRKLGDIDFGPGADVDVLEIERRFFDHWLKDADEDASDAAPVRLFVMGENKWRSEPDWPIPGVKFTPFFLHSGGRANSRFGDGTLNANVPSEELPDRYAYDPAHPVPFLTEPTSHQIGGPDDYRAVERRDDVLVYTTVPVSSAVEVTGPIRLVLHASSSAPDTDFTGKFLDVWPNGFAQRLTDGLVRARFRNGMDAPSLIEPGRIYEYTLDLWNTSQVFLPGHSIRLEVSSSAFPKYDRNLNTGSDLATGTELVVANQMIFHDAAHPSRLVLPLVERPAQSISAPQLPPDSLGRTRRSS